MGITAGHGPSRRTVALTVTAALTLGGFALGVTRGATGSTAAAATVPGTVVVEEDAHGKVLTADSSVRDKRALVDAVHEQRREKERQTGTPTPTPTPTATGGGGGHGDQTGFPVRDQWLDSAKTRKAAVPGGQGTLSAAGASYVKVPFMEYYAIFTDTSSDVSWLGERPFDADSIEHTDTWDVGSVGAPFWVVGAPQGATVRSTGSNAQASWTTTVKDNWYSEHAYDQVAFYPPNQDDYSNVFRISHSVTGTFQFGSSFYTVTTRARAYS
ncbi:hypothetical protein [Streptomyces naganishii]|uniref:Uncharacterized protein n=1 Tax=Streptomyces naganishii JCM 4654 TaxID=1306179 RepID=A0A919CWH1_9ACTN|nr:hypothetical protein [Streptomyces naganishii]GHD90574.1 hypothetical protein GCM10010508_35840 [Streptomyces naganishii JCM 4654]